MSRNSPFPRLSRVEFFLLKEIELIAAVLEAIVQYADDNPSLKRNRSQEAILTWSQMVIGRATDGFERFFFTHGGCNGVEALADLLDSLGVPKAGSLFRSAVEIYRRHESKFESMPSGNGSFRSIQDFEKLDRAFPGIGRQCNRALEKWIRLEINHLANDERGQPIDHQFSGTVEIHHPNGIVSKSLEVKKGKPHGAYREYFDDSSLINVTFYKSGKVTNDFWPDGRIKRKEFKRGDLTIIEWYYQGGSLQKRFVKNKDGYAVEPIRLFHENGQLAEEITKHGIDDLGPWVKFFEDGSPRLQAEYVAGNKLIVRNAWDDDRNQVVTNGTGVFYDDGRNITSKHDLFYELSELIKELKDGVPHGKVTRYEKGVLVSVYEYQNGELEGKSTLYREDGTVKSVTKFVQGKAGRSKAKPKYKQPIPVVILSVVADEQLYKAWDHVAVDDYPCVLNLDEVRQQLKVPDFLQKIHESNLTRTIKSASDFEDGIAYFLTVSETGEVTNVRANGSGVFSGGEWETYKPLLFLLRFTPGRIRGRAIECRVLARVDHTFAEGKAP